MFKVYIGPYFHVSKNREFEQESVLKKIYSQSLGYIAIEKQYKTTMSIVNQVAQTLSLDSIQFELDTFKERFKDVIGESFVDYAVIPYLEED